MCSTAQRKVGSSTRVSSQRRTWLWLNEWMIKLWSTLENYTRNIKINWILQTAPVQHEIHSFTIAHKCAETLKSIEQFENVCN